MKVPFSWLKDYVDIDISAEELQEKLFSCGFEVEELIYVGKEIDRCVVGLIKSVEKHPDADKLKICRIDCGEYGEDIQIVTGADNVAAGDLVPVALDGSSLHGGVKIKKGKLRGVESCGMLCSGEELGITDDYYPGAEVNGILILQEDIPVGTDIKEVVGIDDYIFDISVTANRPDCQSVYGIAREVAAVHKKPLKPVELTYDVETFATSGRVMVEVAAPDLCPRYIAHYVRDLKIESSPLWMKRRLALCGLHSINNVVDITNFVLLELGQPMHAFDLSHVTGSKIVVRRAATGEKIVTLDEKEFELTPDNLVISDGVKPVALAGIMGGLNSGISDDTAEVLFECAKFLRDNVRRTSRALGQKSDSSARYEKGVDAYTTGIAINRALNLIQTLGCGKIACDRYDIEASHPEPLTIHTKLSKICAVLGIEVPKKEIVDILTRLNFNVRCQGDDADVTSPAYREDIEDYPDLAEEVIRMYGYEHIESTFLKNASVTDGGYSDGQKRELRVKNLLRTQGYSETVNYSFISPKDYAMLKISEQTQRAIKIKNPIGEDMSLMRTTLAPSLVNTVVRNLRRGNTAGRLFELASVYRAESLPLTEMAKEDKTLCTAVFGEKETFFTAKGVFELIASEFGLKFDYAPADIAYLHPGKSAEILVNGKAVGYLGELAPDVAESLVVETNVYVGELDYAALSELLGGAIKYRQLPKFPEVQRDLALVAEEKLTCAEIEKVIFEASKYVTSVKLFDVYRGAQVGEGKKSMAFSLTLTPADKAIKPEDADAQIKRILRALSEKLSVELR